MNKAPDIVYRLATKTQWRRAEEHGVIFYEPVDERGGYFHLSTREQMFQTARIYFSGELSMLALAFSVSALASQLKWEAVHERGDELFPHYYGKLKTNAVAHVRTLYQLPSGDFEFDSEDRL